MRLGSRWSRARWAVHALLLAARPQVRGSLSRGQFFDFAFGKRNHYLDNFDADVSTAIGDNNRNSCLMPRLVHQAVLPVGIIGLSVDYLSGERRVVLVLGVASYSAEFGADRRRRV